MNKRMTAIAGALAVLAVLALAPYAAAQGAEERPVPGQRARMVAQDLFDITPEQQKKIEEFRKARAEENKALQEQLSRIRKERAELMKDPAANEAKVAGLIDQEFKIRADQAKRALRTRGEWEKIFTPEQREKMKKYGTALRNRGRFAGRAGMGLRRAPGRGMMGTGMMGRGMMGPGMGLRFRLGAHSGRGMMRHRPFRWRRW